MEDTLTIGSLARKTGVARSAIRFYEKQGLLPEPRRMYNGYRIYPPDAVSEVDFIKTCQKLGLQLNDIRVLLKNSRVSGITCAEVQVVLAAKDKLLTEQIKELRKLRLEIRKEIERTQLRNCTIKNFFPMSTGAADGTAE